MDDFLKFRDTIASNFEGMTRDISHIFEVDVDKDELWNLYLDSFPEGTNEIYRERRVHDCSCCRQFIKNIGNVVTIVGCKVNTIWNVDTGSDTYQPVADALDSYIRAHLVKDVYFSKFSKIGSPVSYEMMDDGKVRPYNHFYLELPNKFINKSRNKSTEYIQSEFRDAKSVFLRSLNELTLDSVETVLELIASNTLYRGNDYKYQLTTFLAYKKEFDKIEDECEKELFAWEHSVDLNTSVAKIRNTAIGTLLIDISEGMGLDAAVTRYERVVAPTNYKRPKAIFTQKMLDDAKAMLTEMGYLESLQRRFANLDDITVDNILFSNKDSAKRISGAIDIFEEMSKSATRKPKNFSKVEEILADKFVSDILPTASELEVYFENRHSNNLMSLIGPAVSDSKTMFKWNNSFSWAYSGNITDSMKDRVKAAGGKIDGDLRFSLQWNEDGTDNCDLDAHCIEPSGEEICYSHKKSRTNGNLDVDIIDPHGKIAVENITWGTRNTMSNGIYTFFVNQYSGSVKHGFRAEIEFDGQIHSFDYPKPMHSKENVKVAEVTLKDGKFSIKELIPSTMASKEIWGITTNQFIPVSVVCYSPNYWDEQTGIGNKHLFFMLKDCKNPENPNGMFNEYLKEDLLKHKRVFEALGSKMAVKDCDDQLSGLGFCMTQRNDIVVKVKGNVERVLKIKF